MKKQDNVITKVKYSIYYLHIGDNIPFYVGKTKDTLQQRYYGHKYKFGSNIIIEELDFTFDKNWKELECYWIEQFRQWGFILVNQNNGGGGLPNHSIESKKKMSDTWKSKSTEELDIINSKRRLSNLGRINPNSGRKKYTNQQKVNLGNRDYYKTTKWLETNSKPVIMLDKNTNKELKEFISISQAARYIKRANATLSLCLSGKQNTCGGYKWKFNDSLGIL